MNKVSKQFKEMMAETADRSVFKATGMSSLCETGMSDKKPLQLVTSVTQRGPEDHAPQLGRGGSPTSVANSTWKKQYHGSGILYPDEKDKDGFTSAFSSKQKLAANKNKVEGISQPPQARY